MTNADKAREAKLRRAAHRQGLHVQKQRTLAPYTEMYGWYLVSDENTNGLVGGANTLDDLENFLKE
ncbi:hypothetical protein ABTZ93_05075 [Streptomyces sp. NPDC097941]|uniref:hypothetical protein n=1 Tax=Streptomyces sp. NPDC097941 TaxID=3155685 RepID=UPI00331BEDB5